MQRNTGVRRSEIQLSRLLKRDRTVEVAVTIYYLILARVNSTWRLKHFLRSWLCVRAGTISRARLYERVLSN